MNTQIYMHTCMYLYIYTYTYTYIHINVQVGIDVFLDILQSHESLQKCMARAK